MGVRLLPCAPLKQHEARARRARALEARGRRAELRRLTNTACGAEVARFVGDEEVGCSIHPTLTIAMVPKLCHIKV